MIPHIPRSDIEISHARSSGPGGQNVNKRSTKAIVKWSVDSSTAFTDEQKRTIKERLASRLNKEGFIVIQYDALRSQEQNTENAVETLQRLVEDALTPQKERKPTKPTRASQRRRLDKKTKISAKKASRSWRHED